MTNYTFWNQDSYNTMNTEVFYRHIIAGHVAYFKNNYKDYGAISSRGQHWSYIICLSSAQLSLTLIKCFIGPISQTKA